jgi:hypothetical protein
VFIIFSSLKAHHEEKMAFWHWGSIQAWPGSGGVYRNAHWLQELGLFNAVFVPPLAHGLWLIV